MHSYVTGGRWHRTQASVAHAALVGVDTSTKVGDNLNNLPPALNQVLHQLTMVVLGKGAGAVAAGMAVHGNCI